MIVLVGESASGKSTIQDILCREYGYKRLVTYTTRSPRAGEKNGVDYHFIPEEEFHKLNDENYFCETAVYNGWHYATATQDCTNDKVVVITPHGLRQILRFNSLIIVSFYINVPRRDRLIKILQRGDDLEEAYRRSLSDVGQFDGISDEVNCVITNDGYSRTAKEIAKEVVDYYSVVNCF